MIITKPSVEILSEVDGEKVIKLIETVGRVCYKSENLISEESSDNFIKNIIKRGHESVLEHYNVTFKVITDRGISHEIVRHRIASYSQESSRYCNYSKDKFGNEITVVKPNNICKLNGDGGYTEEYITWLNACQISEQCYFELLKKGVTPENARSVLPTCLKTELCITMNLRELRHFLKLRTAKTAHPDMRVVAIILLKQLKELIPIMFDDITTED